MDAISPTEFLAFALASKPDLVVHRVDRPETVRVLLKVLANDGRLFDRGGVLVKLVRLSNGGPPIARRILAHHVIVETHRQHAVGRVCGSHLASWWSLRKCPARGAEKVCWCGRYARLLSVARRPHSQPAMTSTKSTNAWLRPLSKRLLPSSWTT